ncbi:protein kinase [bacterium]|nr:protein kinase [bacterium]
MTAFACPSCGREIPLSREHAGKKGVCPACGKPVLAPSQTGPDRASGLADTKLESADEKTVLAPPPAGADRARAPSGRAASSDPLSLEVDRARSDPSKRFGPFVLLSELGKGGMGVVFRAHDERLRRVVALKRILPGTDVTDEMVARFRREAEAVAKLRHPNIVSVHDAGVLEGSHYISMDFIEGATLERRLAVSKEGGPRRLSLAKAIEVVRDVARAVHHAHEKGVLHRDLKPANVLLDASDRPFVLDFGLASVRGSQTRLTKTGAAMGTPAYMPPEQASGEKTDERSDVYSLGATLYQVLTGHPPFSGTSDVNMIVAVLTKDPVPPGEINRRAAGDLETICLRCLEKEPSRRYASARDLADELDRYFAGDAIAARPLGPLARLARRARRNKLASALVALAVLLAGSVAVGAGLYWKGEREREAAVASEREAVLARERRKQREDAREQAASTRGKLGRLLKAGAATDRYKTDELLAVGFEALEAATRFAAVAPEESGSRSGAFATAMDFGDAARQAEQWSVAASAFRRAAAMGVDEARAVSAINELVTARNRVQDEHKRTVEETIAAVLAGKRSHEDALFAFVRLGEPQTVEILSRELDRATALCAEGRKEVYLAAAEPDADEARIGEGRVEGCEVICPRHGARFDLRDGRATRMPATVPILSVPVREEEGRVLVDAEAL